MITLTLSILNTYLKYLMFNVIKITIFSLLLRRQTSQIDIYRINALSIHFLYHILLYIPYIFFFLPLGSLLHLLLFVTRTKICFMNDFIIWKISTFTLLQYNSHWIINVNNLHSQHDSINRKMTIVYHKYLNIWTHLHISGHVRDHVFSM